MLIAPNHIYLRLAIFNPKPRFQQYKLAKFRNREFPKLLECNLVPRISPLPAPWSEREETLVGSDHVSPRIWEITSKQVEGGED